MSILSSKITNEIKNIVAEEFKNRKVQISQKQINEAIIKFFNENKYIITQDGKKLDTYDLIRKFAMETIGLIKNGEINPEFLKIVREEVANIIAKEGLKSYNQNSTIKDSYDEYNKGVIDGIKYAIDSINKKLIPYDLSISATNGYNTFDVHINEDSENHKDYGNNVKITNEDIEKLNDILKSLLNKYLF